MRDSLIPAMDEVRESADELERVVADQLWPLPKYSEMLVIRQHGRTISDRDLRRHPPPEMFPVPLGVPVLLPVLPPVLLGLVPPPLGAPPVPPEPPPVLLGLVPPPLGAPPVPPEPPPVLLGLVPPPLGAPPVPPEPPPVLPVWVAVPPPVLA